MFIVPDLGIVKISEKIIAGPHHPANTFVAQFIGVVGFHENVRWFKKESV